MKIELYYDKECPFCNFYANYVKIKQNHKLILKNAREYKKCIDELRIIGFDINDGFIIKVDEKSFYQGVDAIIFLNKVSSKKVYFYDNIFFRDFIYPSIKLFRKIVLYILGKNSKL